MFWSESDEEKARGSLRQTLRELRALFVEAGYQGFHTDKLAVELERGTIDVDLWAVIRDAEAGLAHPLLLHRPRLIDTLLEGLDDLDPSFRVWLLAKREAIHGRLLRALEAGLRSDDGDASNRLRLAEAIINLDPTHEEACRHLMRAKAEAGDVSGALRAYKGLWDLLDVDYDMEPSVQTQQLVAEIKTGAFERSVPGKPQTAATAAEARLPAIPGNVAARIELSVDTFELNGVEPGKVHLVQGFRQHLIASLVRFREWYVTDGSSRSSQRAARLAVSARYAVQATAYQSGDAVNLVVTLRQVDTDHYVWSETFELRLGRWFEFQQRIVRRLTMALNVNLSTERLMRLAGEPDVSLDIYDRWLRGQAMILSFNLENRQPAAEIFAEIIRLAPNFSPAYSSLAQMNNIEHIVFPGTYRNRSQETQTLALARRAVQLDPSDSRAQLSFAWSLIMAKRYDQAEAPARLAAELNENDPWTLISSASVMTFCGDSERGRYLAGQALDLSPTPSGMHWAYQAGIRFLWEDYEGCLDAAMRAGAMVDSLPGWVAAALFHLGRRDEAVDEVRRLIDHIRSNWRGKSAAKDEVVTQWLLHLYPIRQRRDWLRLRDGLAGAGAPVGGMDHHAW
jgi:DNA-binding SARP family transcriptional activator